MPGSRFTPRYRVGCAGMFAMGMDYGVHDQDEAIACCLGPTGCEVLDTKTGKWIGPYCIEDAEASLARILARRHLSQAL